MTATPEQVPTDLTLEIGENLSPEQFISVARAFFGYVAEITETVVTDGRAVTWVVLVKEGSSMLGMEPTIAMPQEVARVVYARAEHGIRDLIDHNIEDSGLSEPARRHLRTIAEMTEPKAKTRPVPIRLWVEKKPISFDPAIARAVREDSRADYNDYGTIEGRLETIQEGHSNLQFFIRDALLRQRVRCYFNEELLSDVFAKFRKRVEVSGVIHYRRNGTPISIEAENIIGMPDDDELPTARDVLGILSA